MREKRSAYKAFSLKRSKPKPRAGVGLGVFVSPVKTAVLIISLIIVGRGVSIAAVAATKHNLGSFSGAAVKSTETTEICVFCHTPHNSGPTNPMWNKQVPGDNYNPYASLTVVAAQGQPTGSSKLCLSCHDGTIALGSMLNLPGAAEVGSLSVTGTGVTSGMIVPTLPGGAPNPAYIGTDLRDDHPISFDYSLSYPSNVEVKSSDTFPAGVKLDGSNQLQCTSCHNPHGTNYPKFLTQTPEQGNICNACHYKKYWDLDPTSPVHKSSTAVWTGTPGTDINPWHIDMGIAGTSDDTPQVQSCLACHRSHGGATGKSLLKGTNPATPNSVTDEEWTCLNCHNGTMKLSESSQIKDMSPLFDYTRKHDVKGVSGAHVPWRSAPGSAATEQQSNLGTNRHAECADCHNAHALKSGNHTIGGATGNIIGSNLIGAWGVKPATIGWPSAGTAEDQYNYTVLHFSAATPGVDDEEGYLCLKCHSSYAYGINPPTVPSGNANGSVAYQSDPTADFNINNESYHPVFTTGTVTTGKNQPPVNANPNWTGGLGLTNTFRYMDFPDIGQRTGWYSVKHDSAITCSDCHSSHNSSDPQGPHGSNNRWILRGCETGESGCTSANFCYNCHRRKVYGDEGFIPAAADANLARVPHPVDGLGSSSPFYTAGADTGNNSNKFGILCLSCHGGSNFTDGLGNNYMKGVHGSNAGAGPTGDPLGRRMMNGACVESHTHATTTTGVQMTFRVVDTAADKVCKKNFTNFTGNTAIYDYW